MYHLIIYIPLNLYILRIYLIKVYLLRIKMIDVSDLLYRIDKLEAKNDQHEVKVAELETKVAEHELKLNSQQSEIDKLKHKNSDLEESNRQLILAAAKEGDVTSFDFLPRSCFEIKATNPSAQSGVYVIDPDGQIDGDSSIQVYCDMTTRNSIFII